LSDSKRALEAEQSALTAATKRGADIRALLIALLQHIHASNSTSNSTSTATAAVAVSSFVPPADDSASEQAAVVTAKDAVSRLVQELSGALRSKESLQAATAVLQGSLSKMVIDPTVNDRIASAIVYILHTVMSLRAKAPTFIAASTNIPARITLTYILFCCLYCRRAS
jgi:hypothetical protein